MAWADPRDGVGLWWKLVNRNKRTIALDLKDAADRNVLLGLLDDADVLVENFRPGTLERLGLGPDVLLARRPSLVITRVTGFGQDGPYAHRAGFATIAEAMSGLAAISGFPDGQPLLPPIALTDEVTGLAAAFATLVALRSGVGQVVDVSLLESIFQLMGPLASLFAAHRGATAPTRRRACRTRCPVGTYRCSRRPLGRASRASADSVAATGACDLLGVGEDERFHTFAGRMAHRDELEALMRAWCATRTQAEVLAAFEAAEAAIGPVLDMADIAVRSALRGAPAPSSTVDGTPMQGLIAKLSATPGRLDWAGRPMDADGAEHARPRVGGVRCRRRVTLRPRARRPRPSNSSPSRPEAALLAERLELLERLLELTAAGAVELFELPLHRFEPLLHACRGSPLNLVHWVPNVPSSFRISSLVCSIMKLSNAWRITPRKANRVERRADHDLLAERVLDERRGRVRG